MKSEEDERISQLESYILSNNKREHIEGQVTSNKLTSIIQLIHELNNGETLSPECQEALDKLKQSIPYVDEAMKPILLRQLIKEVEREKSKTSVVNLIAVLDQLTVNVKPKLLVHAKPNVTVTSENFREEQEIKLPTFMDDACLDLASEVARIQEDPQFLKTRVYQLYIYFHLDLEKIVTWGTKNNAKEAIYWVLDKLENYSNLKVK